jgi:hypothetical protein
LWAALVGVGAYLLGAAALRVGTVVAVAGGVLLVIIAVAGVLYLRRHMKRLELQAEQAYPGPLDDAGAADAAPAGRRH